MRGSMTHPLFTMENSLRHSVLNDWMTHHYGILENSMTHRHIILEYSLCNCELQSGLLLSLPSPGATTAAERKMTTTDFRRKFSCVCSCVVCGVCDVCVSGDMTYDESW